MNRVIVVEDNHIQLTIFATMLKEAGLEVIKLQSADSIVKIAKNFKPNCILLDIVMPNKSGIEAFVELKNDEETKNIPLVFVTAEDTENNKEIKKLNLENDDILSKPVKKEKLIKRVKNKQLIEASQRLAREAKEALEYTKQCLASL